MARFVIKRFLMMIPVLLGISILVFAIMSTGAEHTTRVLLGPDATEQDMQKLETELGLDKPLLVQYANYSVKALKGDFGSSYRTGEPVSEIIAKRFPITFKLGLLAILISIFVGIPVGILSATKQYSALDSTITVGALMGNSFPSFWLGMLLIFFFSFKLDLLPSFGVDSWQGYILPALTLSVDTSCVIVRMTRSSMLEVIRQDFIRTARGKGAIERIVIYRHALRNALIPIITVAGTAFGWLLGGAIVTEAVFSIPGMGSMLIEAIRKNDTPIVMGGIILMAFAFSFVNLIVDVIYGYVDPRIKADYVR